MKCNQSGSGFELVSPCPYPATITITPRAPPMPQFILPHDLRLNKCFRGNASAVDLEGDREDATSGNRTAPGHTRLRT